MNYLLNAFSLQMLSESNVDLEVREVKTLPENLTSAVGHQDTANVLGVQYNRMNVVLNRGDVAYVAQLTGGRLPEGATTLPEGFTFRYFRVTVR